MTPEQQEEFEKAVQQHIQLAVNAALANMPQQPPQPAAVPAVTVNTVAVKLPECGNTKEHACSEKKPWKQPSKNNRVGEARKMTRV
jgi:hypothetical protein